MVNTNLRRKQGAENPYVRFDAWKVASVQTRRGFLRYNKLAVSTSLMLGIVLLCSSALADRFWWTHKWDSRETTFYSFATADNWKVYDDSGTELTERDAYPGTTDTIDYIELKGNPAYLHFDLDGNSYTVKGLSNTDANNYWDQRKFRIKNGSLTLLGNVTNSCGRFYIEDAGKLNFSNTSFGMFGYSNADSEFIVKSGGELTLSGDYSVSYMNLTVEEGGKCTVNSSALTGESSFHTDNVTCRCTFVNDGELSFPNGIKFNGVDAGGWCGRYQITQTNGTLTLGGDVNHNDSRADFYFNFNGGTLKAIDNVAFVESTYRVPVISMPADATATVDVAEGKTLNLSSMTFGDNTTLIKKGTGTVLFGTSKPTVLKLSEGASYEVAANTALGDWLQLESGSTLIFKGIGISADSLGDLANATVTSYAEVGGTDVAFSSSNKELLALMATKLSAGTGGLGTYTAAEGKVIYETAHDATSFYWRKPAHDLIKTNDIETLAAWSSTYYDFISADTWAIDKDWGTNPNKLIPCSNDSFRVVVGNKPLVSINMNGLHRQFVHYDATSYTEAWGYNGFSITNGTFEFTGSFTNTRAVVKTEFGGKFKLGPNSASRLGTGNAQCFMLAKDGGTIELGGELSLGALVGKVYNGGTMTIAPKDGINLTSSFASTMMHTAIENLGSLSFPNGLYLKGQANADNPGVITLTQRAGTMSFGGSFVKAQGVRGTYTLALNGGKLKATGNADLSALSSVSVPDGASVEFEVDAEKTLTLTGLTFGDEVTAAKSGAGKLTLSAMPQTLAVNAGAIKIAAVTDLGSALVMAENTELELGAFGCSVTDASLAESVSITFASAPPAGKAIFTSAFPGTLQSLVSHLPTPAAGQVYAVMPAEGGYALKLRSPTLFLVK